MKKEQRIIYLELSSEVNSTLCSFCKYSEWEGRCKEAYSTCIHPLYAVRDMTEPYELEPGSDCWGYSPNIPIRDIADIVGIILVNGNDEWSYTTDKDKQILVYTNIY